MKLLVWPHPLRPSHGRPASPCASGGQPILMPYRNHLFWVWFGDQGSASLHEALLCPQPAGRDTRPSLEGPRERSGFREVERRRDLHQRYVRISHQVARYFEPNLIRYGPEAPRPDSPEMPVQRALVQAKMSGYFVRRASTSWQLRPEYLAQFVDEIGSGGGLNCLKIVLKGSLDHYIGACEPSAQEPRRKDQRCYLLVEPDAAAEKGLMRALICGGSSRDQDLCESPVRPAKITKNVSDASQRTFGNHPGSRFSLIRQVAQDCLIAVSREMEHRSASLKAPIGLQDLKCFTEGLRNLHQRAKIAEGGQRDLLTDEKTEMPTVRPLCTQPQERAQGTHGKTVSSARPQAAAQTCFFQDGLGIGPHLTEHVRNNRRDAQIEEPTLGWT